MFFAFPWDVYINEVTPPTDKTKIWVAQNPIRMFVPTSSTIPDTYQEYIDGTEQTVYIYEFSTEPRVLTYSTELERWVSSETRLRLVTQDKQILTDNTRKYLVVRSAV